MTMMPLSELAKVANLYARASSSDPMVAGMIEFIRDVSPLTYLQADTGVGKTHWFSHLFRASETMQAGQTVRYPPSALVTPVLYIDADEGAATFGHLLESPHLIYRRCSEESANVRPWLIRQITEARTNKQCKAIVIEGLNTIFENEIAIEQSKNPGCDKPWELLNKPATHIRNILALIRTMRFDRRKAGYPCPVFVSCNIKSWSEKVGRETVERTGPNMSVNNVRRMLESADALGELSRNGTTTTLSFYDSNTRPLRKLRAPDGANPLAIHKHLSTPNLDPLGFLLLWSEYCRRLALKDPDVLAANEAAAAEQAALVAAQNESTDATN